MNKLSLALTEFQDMDALAAGDSFVHRLHPLVKLLVTVLYIVTVVSFGKYRLSGLIVLALYPALLFQLSGVSPLTCFYKLRLVLPLVCAVGLFNPIFDRAALLTVGGVAVSGGVISMLTLILKGVFALMASFLLMATTPVDSLCAALRKLRVPSLLVTLLLLTYRYITLMLGELAVMTDAYRLRAPGQRGIHVSAWGSFLGQLLLRSMDRAGALYDSMRLRGFRGEFYHADVPPMKAASVLYGLSCAAFFVLARRFDLPALLGGLLVGR